MYKTKLKLEKKNYGEVLPKGVANFSLILPA